MLFLSSCFRRRLVIDDGLAWLPARLTMMLLRAGGAAAANESACLSDCDARRSAVAAELLPRLLSIAALSNSSPLSPCIARTRCKDRAMLGAERQPPRRGQSQRRNSGLRTAGHRRQPHDLPPSLFASPRCCMTQRHWPSRCGLQVLLPLPLSAITPHRTSVWWAYTLSRERRGSDVRRVTCLGVESAPNCPFGACEHQCRSLHSLFSALMHI